MPGLVVSRKVQDGDQHVVSMVDEDVIGPVQLAEIVGRLEDVNEHCGWVKYEYVEPELRTEGDVVQTASGQYYRPVGFAAAAAA